MFLYDDADYIAIAITIIMAIRTIAIIISMIITIFAIMILTILAIHNKSSWSPSRPKLQVHRAGLGRPNVGKL